MAQEQHAGALGHAGDDGVGKRRFAGERHRHLDHDDLRPGLAADIGPGLFQRRIFMVGGQDLVARLEVERARDNVEPGRGIEHAHNVL
ncbi:hypothetical protein D3C71_1955700 [compost metagenome]